MMSIRTRPAFVAGFLAALVAAGIAWFWFSGSERAGAVATPVRQSQERIAAKSGNETHDIAAVPVSPTRAPITTNATTVTPERSSATPRVPSPRVEAPPAPAGSNVAAAPKDNFFDPVYGVTGKIPPGWLMRGSDRWGNQETTLFFQDPEHPDARPSLYYRMFEDPMALSSGPEIEAWLRQAAEAKARQRVTDGAADYTNRDMAMREVGGRPALTWVADYTSNGEPWSEYLTRIYSPDGTILFFMHAPSSELPALIPKFESMIQTTTMP